MKHLSLILTLFSAAPLFAQGGVISASTATDYAVLAGDGTSSGFDSVAVNTPLGPGLAVHAGVGGSASSSGAMAATAVMRGAPAGSNFPNTGLTIHETGRAASRKGVAKKRTIPTERNRPPCRGRVHWNAPCTSAALSG